MPTPTEEFLGRICRRSFLSLWSHPHVYRDTTPVPHELCDVLVVFGDNVLLFSDKSMAFPRHHDLRVAWGRWYRGAILESSNQLYGAARWLREHPERVFADQKCTRPLRVPLPSPARANYHLIAVAWGAGEGCQAYFGPGSSPSLFLKSDLIGNSHLDYPFTVGWVDAKRSFVHVFDELSLQLVMREVDTTPDLIEYLDKRVALLTNSNRVVLAVGEEELLARYLTNTDEKGSHVFLTPEESKSDGILFAEGGWKHYATHPQRQRKVAANEVSYVWDRVIEHLIEELPEHSQPQPDGSRVTMDREAALRVMASETRFARRMLGRLFADLMESTRKLAPLKSKVRIAAAKEHPETAYVFLVFGPDPSKPFEKYQTMRNRLLQAYCQVLCLELPEARDIVGIATVPPECVPASEVLCYVRNENLGDEFREQGRRLQAELNILKNVRDRLIVERVDEYPSE